MAVAWMLFLGLAAQAPAPAATPADAPIRNFLKVSPEFCTGGQPRPEHFAKLKAEGVKAVLNLRTPGEHRADDVGATYLVKPCRGQTLIRVIGNLLQRQRTSS